MKYETAFPPPWKLGEFISSADPRKKVLMVATGASEIKEYGAHRDFIRWVAESESPELDGSEAVKVAYAMHKYAQGTRECIAFWRGAQWAYSLRQVAQPKQEHDLHGSPVRTVGSQMRRKELP